jgi:glycosyltransferase involved in cell wall biosynthesis
MRKADRILISSRIFKRKGIQYFLKSVEDLSSDFEIHIAGDGPYLEKLKQQAARMSSVVHFHGYLENTSEKFKNLMETSKIFVLPSISENFSISLLEAMACGMAIITTRDTAARRWLGCRPSGTPRGWEGLRNAYKLYKQSDYFVAVLAKMARKRLEENFSWEIRKKYIAFIMRLNRYEFYFNLSSLLSH